MACAEFIGESDKTAKSGSDLESEMICSSCSFEDSVVQGLWFCFDCQEYLCDECYRYHRKLSLLRGHVVKGKDSRLCNVGKSVAKDSCTDTCAVHEGKIMEYYCVSHDAIACSVCMTLLHKNCDDTDYIPNIAKSESVMKKIDGVGEKLKSLHARADVVAHTTYEHNQRHQVCVQQVLETVQDLRTRVIKSFDAFENGVRKEMAQYAGENVLKFSDVKASCNRVKQDVEHIQGIHQTLKENDMYCKLFLETQKIKLQIRALEEALHKTYKECFVQDFTLTIDKQTKAIIKSIESLATLRLKNLGNSTLRHAREISVKCVSDKTKSKTTGMAIIPPDTLVIADNQNTKIKLIDIASDTVTSELKLSSDPWEITKVTDVTIATTIEEEGKIVILNVNKGLLGIDKYIAVHGKCRGISYENNLFAIGYVEPGKIELVDMEGAVYRCISTEIACPSYIVFQGNSVFVSNYGDSGVYHLDTNGVVLNVYKKKGFNGACGLLEESGYIYVCGWHSKNIFMIDENTGQFTEILGGKDRLKNPYSMVHDRENNRLYIGMRDVDHIQVFDAV